MHRASCGVLVLAFLSSGVAAAEEPAWLKEARQRDAKPAAIVEIASEDGAVRMRVPAKLVGKIEVTEGAHALMLDIGGPEPASCELLYTPIDMAGFLRATADLIFQRLGPIQGEVEAKAVERTDAGVIAGQPYMALDWIYRVKSDKGPLLGGLKQFVATKSGVAIFCSHIDLGYSKSFRSVMTALVESLELKSQHVQPYFTEVATMALGEVPAGISVTTLTKAESGDTRVSNFTAMLIPNGENAPHAIDTADVQMLRADGSLISASHATATNGSLETQFQLAKDEQGKWAVQGNMKGKPVTASLDGSIEPMSFVQQIRARKELLAGAEPSGQERNLPSWIAQNPTEVSQWRMKVLSPSGSGRFAAQEAVGGVAMDTVVDAATGLVLEGRMAFGPQTIRVQSVHVGGSP